MRFARDDTTRVCFAEFLGRVNTLNFRRRLEKYAHPAATIYRVSIRSRRCSHVRAHARDSRNVVSRRKSLALRKRSASGRGDYPCASEFPVKSAGGSNYGHYANPRHADICCVATHAKCVCERCSSRNLRREDR